MFPISGSLTVVVLHILLTTLGSVVAISFVEYGLHRHAMHRKRFWKWIYRVNPDLSTQFHNHAVMHHGTYYKTFDHEPTAEGKYFNLRILPADTLRLLVLFSPLIALLAVFVSVYSAVTLAMMVVVHNQIWSAVHVQMHVPEENRSFRNSAYFRFIARHHFMHHQSMGKNYNVVFPLADFIMGTATTPRVSDVREMLRLGYLTPRTAAGQRRLDAYRLEQAASVRQLEAAPQTA